MSSYHTFITLRFDVFNELEKETLAFYCYHKCKFIANWRRKAIMHGVCIVMVIMDDDASSPGCPYIGSPWTEPPVKLNFSSGGGDIPSTIAEVHNTQGILLEQVKI